MKNKKITDQRAFEQIGIPTPPNQEDVTPTDMVSDAVAGIVDNIQKTITGKPQDQRSSQQKR